jgi:hypothetical protein
VKIEEESPEAADQKSRDWPLDMRIRASHSEGSPTDSLVARVVITTRHLGIGWITPLTSA